MSLDHILLGMLRRPASGYDLRREFESSAQHFWYAELSQIYPVLKRLEGKGWLTSRAEPSERGPERRVYEVTESGRAELVRWLEEGPQFGHQRIAHLAQLFFMDELGDPGRVRDFVGEVRTVVAKRLATLEAIEAPILDAHGNPDGFPDGELYRFSTLRLGIEVAQARIRWCDETIKRLEARVVRSAGLAEAGTVAPTSV